MPKTQRWILATARGTKHGRWLGLRLLFDPGAREALDALCATGRMEPCEWKWWPLAHRITEAGRRALEFHEQAEQL